MFVGRVLRVKRCRVADIRKKTVNNNVCESDKVYCCFSSSSSFCFVADVYYDAFMVVKGREKMKNIQGRKKAREKKVNKRQAGSEQSGERR